MYIQWQKYRSGVSCDRGDTYKVDLPKSGILSCIYLEQTMSQAAGAPYAASAQGKWRLVDIMTDISVIANGRADVFTMPGRLCQYMAYLDQGITVLDKIREYSAASQMARFLVNFGRHMFDPALALGVGQFDNVELNVTNDGTSTYWASTYSMDIWLGWLRGAGAPPGTNFYQKQMWRQYTGSQDHREYLELPTSLPIRRIVLQADPNYNATTGMSDCEVKDVLYGIKLTFQNGVITAYDGAWLELAYQNYLELGFENFVNAASYHQADYGFDMGIGDIRGMTAISGARDGSGSATVPTREGDLSKPTQKLEAYEADSPVDLMVRGAGYHNCVVFPFDRLPDGGDLLNPAKGADGIVELELHNRDASSVASSTVRVVLDRLCTSQQLSA